MSDNLWNELAEAFYATAPPATAPPATAPPATAPPSPSSAAAVGKPLPPVVSLFGAPQHIDARAIWSACGFQLSDKETRETIEKALWIWATDNNMLKRHPTSGIYEIAWKRTSDVGSHTIRSAWPAFLKWFFMTSSKQQSYDIEKIEWI